MADFEARDIFGDVTGGVGLNQERELALVIVGGDGCIGAYDLLAVDVGSDGDVLADGEAEDVVCAGEIKAITVSLSLAFGGGGAGGGNRVPYIPTLWDTTVVSASSKSWNTSGFNIVLDSEDRKVSRIQ